MTMLTMIETQILNELSACYPNHSSIKKLTTKLGRERGEVVENLEGLERLKYVRVTQTNTVYLLKHGKKHLGLETYEAEKTASDIQKEEVPGNEEKQPVNEDNVVEIGSNQAKHDSDKIFAEIREAGQKLTTKAPVLIIDDIGLKQEALRKFGEYLSDDLRELFNEVADDLANADALLNPSNPPQEAA